MKKRFMRLFTGFLIAIALVGVFPGSAFALSECNVVISEEIPYRAEETTTYYRYNNGVLQYRIWSNTYGKWLTEWTNC